MEDWVSQLEMEWNNEDILTHNNDLNMQYNLNDQEMVQMDSFHEELALILGDDFPSPLSSETSLPKVASNLSMSNEQVSPPNNCNLVVNNNLVIGVQQQEEDRVVSERQGDQETNKQQDGNGNKMRKRRREPSQIYDHIMAERKRRELLAQLFIALSAMIPGLKKVDKTTILGEAIKQMKQLQGKVKELEEVVAKQNVESTVMVKTSQPVIDKEDDYSSCIIDNNHPSEGGGGGGAGGDDDGYMPDSLPEIEAKVSKKTLLLRIICEKRKGISAKIFEEVEKRDNVLTNSNIATFGASTINITIIAQTEKTGKKQVEKLVKSLHAILRSP